MYDLWAFRYLDYAVQMGFFYVLKQVPVYLRCLEECYSSVRLRLSRGLVR